MFDLIVFDLDGTLVDSRRDLAEATNALLGEAGAPPLSVEAIGRMVGEGAARLVARAFAAAHREAPAGALERFLELYDERLLGHTRPYDGIPDVLAELAARSRLAVLTNKPLAATRRLLDGVGLAPFFRPGAVLGGDGPWPRKPDPAGLLALAAQAQVPPPATILVGDSVIDWRTARNAGTAVCLARYGFGAETMPAEATPDRSAASAREIPAALL
jgi:phosphoglycolate phosphatase